MAIKSAYELAMERMGKSGASLPKLSDEQKKQIAEIDNIYKAKIAETELRLNPKIQDATFAGNQEEADKLHAQLTKELRSLREDLETKKEKVRQAKK